MADRNRSLEALERQHEKGYRRKPEDPAVGKVGEKMAAEVWPQESWDDIWLSSIPKRRRKRTLNKVVPSPRHPKPKIVNRQSSMSYTCCAR